LQKLGHQSFCDAQRCLCGVIRCASSAQEWSMDQMRDPVSRSTATEGGRVMSSNRLRRQGRIAWKLVAARRDADTLAGPNGDMLARAEVMHRFGVGRSTQGEQQGEGQSGTHPRQSYRTSPADVHTSGHDPKMQLLHDRSNWRDHRARRGCDRRTYAEPMYGRPFPFILTATPRRCSSFLIRSATSSSRMPA